MTDSHSLDQIEVDHARFNALKTLSTSSPSAFESQSFGALTATRDRQRNDSYYNRILGFRAGAEDDLAAAVEWISGACSGSQQVRADVVEQTSPENNAVQRALSAAGFEIQDRLVWLTQAPAAATAMLDTEGQPARALSAVDWPTIRELLEHQGAIADSIWNEKKQHLCTEVFQWFGIFDAETLVSAASLWVGPQAAILGSAYTVESHRGRGYQRRLLETRKAAGSSELLVDVEPESVSYRNCVRAGFSELERRHVWTRTL